MGRPGGIAQLVTLGAAVGLVPAARCFASAPAAAARDRTVDRAAPFADVPRPGYGAGAGRLPRTGACVVIANHACWFDPAFIGRVLPRPITPMMTSEFSDLPGIRWLMVHVFGTIRVQEKRSGNVSRTRRGGRGAGPRRLPGAVPRGLPAPHDDKPMKRFGRGVWHILSARPDVPVVACWIEGAWGSFTSYRGGYPTKGKRPDLRRPIDVGVPLPVTVPAAELKAHLAAPGWR